MPVVCINPGPTAEPTVVRTHVAEPTAVDLVGEPLRVVRIGLRFGEAREAGWPDLTERAAV